MGSTAPTWAARSVGLDREQRFFALVEAHQERAVRVAWHLIGGDGDAAEDIAQQAFLKAYRGLHRFRDDAALATWFYRILVNEARSHRRWRMLRDHWHAIWAAEAGPDSVAAASPAPGLQQRLAQALDRLTGTQREVFVLVYLEGFTLEQTDRPPRSPLGPLPRRARRAAARAAPVRSERPAVRRVTASAASTDEVRAGTPRRSGRARDP
jgi:RNA polymerase sigma-70 factor, ECF subfamily